MKMKNFNFLSNTRQYLPNKEIIIEFPSIFKKLCSLRKTVQTIKNQTLKQNLSVFSFLFISSGALVGAARH